MSIALSIEQLTKIYDKGFQALKGIDLEVQEGDFFALLGPNGAGKSTTIGVICSLVRKSGGRVSIFGHDIDKDFALAKKMLGVVPQEFNFPQFETVADIVANQAGYYGLRSSVVAPRIERYLKQLGLWDKRDTQAFMLSGGMKRRLMIARALVHEPRLLILDEPTAGVDIELRRSMWEFLQEINRQGTTIILTTHYLEEAESLCRNIAIIDEGRIVENTSMKALLKTLDRETFILDLRTAIGTLPDALPYDMVLVDDTTLEVGLPKGASLSGVFSALAAVGVDVVSMRNKANRLEELFVNLIHEHDGKSAAKLEEVSA